MAISLSNEIRALLDGPNFAHLATLMTDGSPQSAPVWVGREGDRILICTGEGSLKAKNTRRDPTPSRTSTHASRSRFAAPKEGWR
jgi:nitroimidazol reductase NimA-like FMN-containing flavoprotein (pyridoxamine 5'-phosphate oxidase superfamily)